jgi:hypothetical protein
MNPVSFFLRLLGGFLVVAGLLVNQFTVAEYLSGDGILEYITKISILVYNITVTSLGAALLISRRLRENIGAELITIWRICRRTISFLAAVTICLLVVFQISTIATAIYRNSDNSAVIFAQDWDAGRHIEISRDAKWGVSHTDRGYGALYFRLANLLLTKTGIDPNSNPELFRSVDQALHYSLQFISLLALLGIALVLSILSTRSWYIRIWMFFLLSAVLLRNELWVTQTFRATPDLMLAFFVVLYLFALLNRSDKHLPISSIYSAGVVAALGLSTKVTFGPYLLAALLSLTHKFDKRAALNIVRFGFTVCLVYLFIGFPNTLKIFEMIHAAFTEAAVSTVTPTLSSLAFWISYMFREGIAGMGVCFLGGILDRTASCENEWLKKNRRLLIGAAIPVAYLITWNLNYSELLMASYQGLPQLVSLYFIAGVLGRYCAIKLRDFISEEVRGKVLQGIVILTGSWVMVSGVVPENISGTFEKSFSGREEFHETARAIEETIRESTGLLFIELAGIPYRGESNAHIKRTHVNITLSDISDLTEAGVTAVILNQHQLRYMMGDDVPMQGWLDARENYLEIRKFYALFYENLPCRYYDYWTCPAPTTGSFLGNAPTRRSVRKVEDPFGSIWELVYEDLNGVQIWKRRGQG